MILPYPEEIQSLKRFPLTLTLAALNVLLFVMIFSGNPGGDVSSSALLDSDGLVLTGRLYHQYYDSLPRKDQARRPSWVQKTNSSDTEHLGVLGAYALRDANFVAAAEKFSFKGDVIQIEGWKKHFTEFRKKYKAQLLYRFGLSSLEMKPLSWVTYQFSHSTWMHLLSNLVFLVVMGMAVESMVGSAGLVLVYLLGGFLGGLGFLIFDPSGTVPMVGASASISALLAFYCVAEPRMRVRFLYLVSPMPGYYGAIYLPTLLMIPLFLVSDVANLWATPEGLGAGVAYAAHLGGAVLGVFLGTLYRFKKPLQLEHHIVKYFS
ncbi:rhomboid family intramembrane serine protease [Bdellovibrio bacteriovorus]|uniref:Rhomboid family intramembrane serine protease n=1 Tax=Bdellovibrio bacteriovorus TaxID=959 RepID=A0A150WFD9_BDEBC|nr:rhomboid family intramembrane serine protease [Bdellovibrio bacteriovorus]KYG61663.1 rhomboid family intramembrane serine protease [Bdellovibrio bacteriovorus]